MKFAVFMVLFAGTCLSQCQSTFTAKNASQISWCVTENGEIESLSVPGNYNQIVAEGYAICDPGEYWSVGGQESGWKKSVITQPGGPNTLPLTIYRETTDGKVTLTQTFSWPQTGKVVGVKMFITGALNVYRYAELDPSQNQANNTTFSAFGWMDGFIGTFMRSGKGVATVTNGGVRNICRDVPTNQNNALKMRFSYGNKKNTPYLEYSAIF